MKTYYTLITLLLCALVITGCKNNDPYFSDETIIVSNQPAISIYKTNGDYFNYVFVGTDSLNEIVMIPDYTSSSPFITTDKNGKVSYNQRWKLKSGYIVCKEMKPTNIAFTNITFQELIDYTNASGGITPPVSWYKNRIVDKAPFTQYYQLTGIGKEYNEFSLGQLNKLVEEGKIETLFKKMK